METNGCFDNKQDMKKKHIAVSTTNVPNNPSSRQI